MPLLTFPLSQRFLSSHHSSFASVTLKLNFIFRLLLNYRQLAFEITQKVLYLSEPVSNDKQGTPARIPCSYGLNKKDISLDCPSNIICGNRNDMSFSISCSLVNNNFSAEEMEQFDTRYSHVENKIERRALKEL